MTDLAPLVARHASTDGLHGTAWPSLDFIRISTLREPIHNVQEPALCVVVQGAKRVMLGAETFTYDADRFLLVSLDLPLIGEIVEASESRPYLAFRLSLDPATIAGLLATGLEIAPVPGRGIGVSPLEGDLRESIARLLRLLQTPEHLPTLGPLAEREILYRLLMGPEGGRLSEIAKGGAGAHRVARAIEVLRRDYARDLRIADLARENGMSLSGFHHHFKAATAMSPVQFQKRLRLQEARRLMMSEGLDAASAAFRVGYESPSQFSREYRRLFGAPPMRDVSRWKGTPAPVF